MSAMASTGASTCSGQRRKGRNEKVQRIGETIKYVRTTRHGRIDENIEDGIIESGEEINAQGSEEGEN